MLKLALTLLLFSPHLYAAFQIPSQLNLNNAKNIVDDFGVGFVAKVPFYFKDKYEEPTLKTHVHGSLSLIETTEVAKLGTGTSKDPIQSQLVHFGLELPFQIDLGLQTSLISVDNRIQQFGGFARWSPYQWNGFTVTTTLHGSSTDIKSQLAVNFYGGMIGLDYQWDSFNFFSSTGYLRNTSSFQGALFVTPTLSRVTIARDYSHQVFRVSFSRGPWTLSGQSDWIDKFHSTVLVGYQF